MSQKPKTLTLRYDYVHAKKIKEVSSVVTENNISDTHQLYEVIAVASGEVGYQEGERFVDMSGLLKPGARFYAQKHAEADTPGELLGDDEVLILVSRVMAVIGG